MTLRIWDPNRDQPLLNLFFAGSEWIAWTPEGYYACSPGGEGLMGWHLDNGPDKLGTFAPAAQFREKFYRPARSNCCSAPAAWNGPWRTPRAKTRRRSPRTRPRW